MNYKNQLSPLEGSQKLLDLQINRKTEKISSQQALGRITSQNIYARLNVPEFNKSPYDGYSLRAEDTKEATEENPAVLQIIEEIPAGHKPKKALEKNQAAKILTGGALPKGANVCIKYEYTSFTKEEVKIFSSLKANSDIVWAGEDTKKGDLLIEKGDKLGPFHLGLLASQGIEEVEVYKKPKLGFFATGTELVPLGQDLTGAKIYDSNSLTFMSIFSSLGFEVINFGPLADEKDLIKEKTLEALEKCDLLVTTGGASVGDYDYAYKAIEDLGGQVLFWKVAMKPGGSLVASRLNDKTVLSLSGNPGAASLGLFKVFLPYLKSLLGYKKLEPKKISVLLESDFNKPSPRLRLLRGNLVYKEGQVFFRQKEDQGNSILSSFLNCQGLGEIKAGTNKLKAGSLIDFYFLSDLIGSGE